MKMCAVTSLMKFYPLPAALATIADAGYDGVELWGGLPHAFADDFHEDGRLSTELVGRARALIDASGLELVSYLPEQCFYPVNFLIEDAPPFDGAKLRERSVAYFERAIDVAAALGSPKMAVTTPFWGWRRAGDRFVHTTEDKALDRVIEVFGRLARHAEKRGVVLVLEPLTFLETTAVETLDDLLAVLDGVGSRHLASMIDTGHVNVTATALGLNPSDYWDEHVQRLGDRLQHVHIDDNKGDVDAHLLPGEGSFDFPRAYRMLQQSGYRGHLSAELMMFGANPVPPLPAELLRRTRSHTEQAWNA